MLRLHVSNLHWPSTLDRLEETQQKKKLNAALIRLLAAAAVAAKEKPTPMCTRVGIDFYYPHTFSAEDKLLLKVHK